MTFGETIVDPRAEQAYQEVLDQLEIDHVLDLTDALEERTRLALRRGGYAGELGAHVPPDEIDELQIIATYLSSHPDLPQVMLERRELPNETAAR